VDWFFVISVPSSSLSWRWRVDRLRVSSSLSLFPLWRLKLPIQSFCRIHSIVKRLLLIISELHILILLVLILEFKDLAWRQMPHPFFNRHFHDLRERQFICVFGNEFIHFFSNFLGPKLLLIVQIMLFFVIYCRIN